MDNNFQFSELTSKIIKAYFKVYNTLGYGFLEKVYENAMMIELRREGLICEAQIPIDVYYEDCKIGYYVADIIVDDSVILELKATESLCEEHEAKLINYLKASDIEVGLLLNFGKKTEFKRKVFGSEYKNLNPS